MSSILLEVTPEMSRMITQAGQRMAGGLGAELRTRPQNNPVWYVQREYPNGEGVLVRTVQIAPYADYQAGETVLTFSPRREALTRDRHRVDANSLSANPQDIVRIPINPVGMDEAKFTQAFDAAFAQAWAKTENPHQSHRPADPAVRTGQPASVPH